MSSFQPDACRKSIRSLYADDPEIHDIVVEFVDEMPARIEAGQRAFMRGDLLRLHFWAHQLKGGASGYGFPTISERAAELETAIVDHRSLDEIFTCMLRVIDHCERASVI